MSKGFLIRLTLILLIIIFHFFFPASIYMFRVNNRNTKTRCEICSKLTMKTAERRYGVELAGKSVQSYEK